MTKPKTKGAPVEATPAPRHDLWRGKRVIWRHKPKGGYGYVMRLPVTVVEVLRATVRIRTETGKFVTVKMASIIDPPSMIDVVATVEAR